MVYTESLLTFIGDIMSKYSGDIGFGFNRETEFDAYDDDIKERHYFGDIERNVSRYNQNNTISGETLITNTFSIVGDTFLFENLMNVRYICWKNERWLIASIEEQYPRVNITLGGIYNGPTPTCK